MVARTVCNYKPINLQKLETTIWRLLQDRPQAAVL